MIELSADLGLKLDATLDDVRRYVNRLARKERTFERYLSRPFGFFVPEEPLGTSQVAVAFDVGGPSEGRVWQVDRFVADVAPLGGKRPQGVTVALASAPGERQGETILLRADSIFWSGMMTEYAEVGYPASERFSSRQFIVQPLDHLYVLVVQPDVGEEVEEVESHQVAGRIQITDVVYHEVGVGREMVLEQA